MTLAVKCSVALEAACVRILLERLGNVNNGSGKQGDVFSSDFSYSFFCFDALNEDIDFCLRKLSSFFFYF